MKIFYFLWGWLFPYKTKAYRKEIYKKVLEFYEEGYYGGFCGAIYVIEEEKFAVWNNMYRFPELYKYKPFWKSQYDLWWDVDRAGISKRMNILQKESK